MKSVATLLTMTCVGLFARECSGQDVDFNRQIRPILSQHCLACHGLDEESREADLRLDIREEALAAIEPGELESSEAWIRITSDDEDRMPPADHGAPLSEREIELVGKWIEQGASYQEHWSFVAPAKRALPQLDSSTSQWARNEIDHFVGHRLGQLKLGPMPDADPRRLIRRLALDLTGLPPAAELVDRFAQSPTDETYAGIVDELLSSPRYGEHWTGMWLDLARYADTIGYASDSNRTIWPWRDWVIRAFNSNMPYDQFTIEQLAGDLLPNPTTDQRLATAFHRNTLNNSEGGTNDEEFRTIAVKDRINTTVNVWMGLTLRCAECHTHKYDPISQKEYYQFMAFFNQTMDEDKNDERPRLEVFPAGRDDEYAKLDAQIENLRQQLSDAKPVWNLLLPIEVQSRDGATLTIESDQSILASGQNPNFDEYSLTFQLPKGTHQGLRMEVFPSEPNNGNVGRSPEGSFVLSQLRAEVGIDKTFQPVKFSEANADFSQVNYGIELTIRDVLDKLGWAVNHPEDGFRVPRTGVFSFAKPLKVETPTKIKIYLTFQSPWNRQTIGKLRMATTTIAKPAKKFKQKKLDPIYRKLESVIKKRNSPIRVPVMVERPPKRQRVTHVMTRGSYLQPAEQVQPAVFKAFPPLALDATPDRLAVARWLVADENPLTARVTVNRFWARIFGQGIVETEEDFGTQGAPPSNQELLDWLAVDFREQGWDLKRLLRKIVTSSTYRQSSIATVERIAADPDNRFHSRGPRFRLRAEVIRDQALAVSGLLSDRMYGPPVYPPNPVKSVRSAFAGQTVWVESKGDNRYRRALYTYLKRSSPHPLFETFDMATREVCNLRRIRTNTPLQSFMTLNGRSFVEAAQALAVQMHRHDSTPRKQLEQGLQIALLRPGTPEQINGLESLYSEMLAAYRIAPAEAAELTESMLELGLDREVQDSRKAELAALTVVANVILNLDAILTK